MSFPSSRGHRHVFGWIAGLLSVLGASFCIYYRMFTDFSQYDDDGYVLITIRSLLNGQRLYDDVYTQYGPFYYLVHWPLYTFSGLPLSHDAERMLAVAIWLLAAVFWGRATYLMTGSLLWSGFG